MRSVGFHYRLELLLYDLLHILNVILNNQYENLYGTNMSKEQVFISYAKEDKGIAVKLYHNLKERGVAVWLDSEDLLVGQDWEYEIGNAIRKSRFFIALLSNCSISKRGFVQKELKEAMDVLDEFPPDQPFVLPVRIAACKPTHKKLECIHWADLFPSYDDGLKQILRVLKLDLNRCKEPKEVTEFKSKRPSFFNLKNTLLIKIVLIKYLVGVRKYKIDHIHKALIESTIVEEFWIKLSHFSGKKIAIKKMTGGGYTCNVNRDLNKAKLIVSGKIF